MSKPVFAEGVTSPRPRIRTNSPPPSSFRSQLVVVYVVSTSSSFLVVQRNPFSSLVPTPSLFSRSVHVPRRRPAREKNLSREIDCSSKWIDSTPFPPNIFFKGNASSIDPPHQRERFFIARRQTVALFFPLISEAKKGSFSSRPRRV